MCSLTSAACEIAAAARQQRLHSQRTGGYLPAPDPHLTLQNTAQTHTQQRTKRLQTARPQIRLWIGFAAFYDNLSRCRTQAALKTAQNCCQHSCACLACTHCCSLLHSLLHIMPQAC
jgi:hypothetical protein